MIFSLTFPWHVTDDQSRLLCSCRLHNLKRILIHTTSIKSACYWKLQTSSLICFLRPKHFVTRNLLYYSYRFFVVSDQLSKIKDGTLFVFFFFETFFDVRCFFMHQQFSLFDCFYLLTRLSKKTDLFLKKLFLFLKSDRILFDRDCDKTIY